MDLKPGSVLDRYEILMPVAQGGMAAVWAARMAGSRGFTKIVAIKTMLPHMSDDPDFEAMFIDEATLASRIRHPHVVEIVDVGEEQDLVYLVMEWVNGETMFTLNKRAKEQGGIPLPLLLRMSTMICAGLHAAHELRNDKGELVDLVHRDVSPQNVMITFDGIVKLVDFGVAKAAGRAHETRVTGLMKGKVPYLSPEQLTSGAKVDRRADIFALGILLYVTITGRHPFRGPTDSQTMENICTKEPVALTELVPDCRPELEAIVLRALAKQPSKRWPNCAEMQRALDSVLTSVGTTVTDGDIASFVRNVLGDVVSDRNERLAAAIRASDARGQSGGHRLKVPRPRSSAPASDAPAGPEPTSAPVASSDASAPVASTPAASAPAASAPRVEDPIVDRAPLPATFGGILPVKLDASPDSNRSLPRSDPAPITSRSPSDMPPPKPRYVRSPERASGSPRQVEPPRTEPPRSRLDRPSPSPAALVVAPPRRQRRSQWPLYAFGIVAALGGLGLAVRAGVIPAPFGLGQSRPPPVDRPKPEPLAPPSAPSPPSPDPRAIPSGAPSSEPAALDAGAPPAKLPPPSFPPSKWPPKPPSATPPPVPPPTEPDPYDDNPPPPPPPAGPTPIGSGL